MMTSKKEEEKIQGASCTNRIRGNREGFNKNEGLQHPQIIYTYLYSAFISYSFSSFFSPVSKSTFSL